MPSAVVPLQLGHGGAHALGMERRQLPAPEGHGHDARPGLGTQGKDQCRAAVGIRDDMLHGEPAAELAVAVGHREGDRRVRQQVAVLIPYLHDQGLGQGGPGHALLAIARDDLQGRGTGLRPLRDVPQQHRAVVRAGNQVHAVGRQGHLIHRAGMSFQSGDDPSGCHVPQLDPAPRTGREHDPIVRERHGVGSPALQGVDGCPGTGVPQPDAVP